jgi:hypothetical protein
MAFYRHRTKPGGFMGETHQGVAKTAEKRDMTGVVVHGSAAGFAQVITSTIPTAAIISRLAYSSPPYSFRGHGNGEPGQITAVAALPKSA